MLVSVWSTPHLLPPYLCVPVFPVCAGQCVEYTSPPASLSLRTCISCLRWSVCGVHLTSCLPISAYLYFLSALVCVWSKPYLLPTCLYQRTCISRLRWSVFSVQSTPYLLPTYLSVPVFPVHAGQWAAGQWKAASGQEQTPAEACPAVAVARCGGLPPSVSAVLQCPDLWRYWGVMLAPLPFACTSSPSPPAFLSVNTHTHRHTNRQTYTHTQTRTRVHIHEPMHADKHTHTHRALWWKQNW